VIKREGRKISHGPFAYSKQDGTLSINKGNQRQRDEKGPQHHRTREGEKNLAGESGEGKEKLKEGSVVL